MWSRRPRPRRCTRQIRSGALGPCRHTRRGPRVTESTHLPSSERAESSQLPEPPRPLFVAREEELAHLERWLAEALHGQGRVGFVVGEPGSGKTDAAARVRPPRHGRTPRPGRGRGHRQRLHRPRRPLPALPRDAGSCSPGDVEARRAVGAISREQARRLGRWPRPRLEALLERGPDADRPAGLGRSAAGALPQGRCSRGAAWRSCRASRRLARRAGLPPLPSLEQVAQVLQALARQRPLLLVLDDLQWADGASINLLFHLGRQAGRAARILVSGRLSPGGGGPGPRGRAPPPGAGAGRVAPPVGREHPSTWRWPRGASWWTRWWIASPTAWERFPRDALPPHRGPRPVHRGAPAEPARAGRPGARRRRALGGGAGAGLGTPARAGGGGDRGAHRAAVARRSRSCWRWPAWREKSSTPRCWRGCRGGTRGR